MFGFFINFYKSYRDHRICDNYCMIREQVKIRHFRTLCNGISFICKASYSNNIKFILRWVGTPTSKVSFYFCFYWFVNFNFSDMCIYFSLRKCVLSSSAYRLIKVFLKSVFVINILKSKIDQEGFNQLGPFSSSAKFSVAWSWDWPKLKSVSCTNYLHLPVDVSKI
jgi:hypothetical protein